MVDVPQVFLQRQMTTDERMFALQAQLASFGTDAGTACVYATGSVARREANEHSDLDIFILDAYDEQLGELPLSRTSSTLLRADLIRSSSIVGYPPFSGDGIYLETHTVSRLIAEMGSRSDDYSNSFTARMLLVLESRAILNSAAHDLAKSRVIDSYWRDYKDNDVQFSPIFLINDLMRYWKTVCVNYEADRTAGAPTGVDAQTWKFRSRLRNVKLKFSRLWMCHATIAHLLWLSRKGNSVTKEQAGEMMSLTPLERVTRIAESGVAEREVGEMLSNYAWFLERFSGSRDESRAWVGSQSNWMDARSRGVVFGDAVSRLLAKLAEDSSLYRYLLV